MQQNIQLSFNPILFNTNKKNSLTETLSKEVFYDLYHIQKLSLQDISDICTDFCREKVLSKGTHKTSTITRQCIYKLLKHHDIPLRNKSEARALALKGNKINGKRHATVNKNFFNKWSPGMAWVLGLAITDGNVFGNRFDISQRNPEILYKIRTLMQSDKPIYKATNTNGNPIHYLSFYNKDIVLSLAKRGVVPRKSLIVKFPRIPSRFLSHFIRGLLDGDGSVTSNRVDLCSGSKDFITTFQKKINQLIPGNPCKVYMDNKKKNLSYRASIFQKDARYKLYFFIYTNVPSSIYSSAKKKAFNQWIRKEKVRCNKRNELCPYKFVR